MGDNYLLSSLLPYIHNDDMAYYANLDDETISLLTSLAPFVSNSEQLKKISQLDIESLEKASEALPIMNDEEIIEYLQNLESN